MVTVLPLLCSLEQNYKQSHMFVTRDGTELGSNQGVRVFAPQYPTQKGRVLGQLWYLPTLETILIVQSLSYAKHTRKILWPLKI